MSVFTHLDLQLRPDPSRTVLRPFLPGDPPPFDKSTPRPRRIAERVTALDKAEFRQIHELVMTTMGQRHRDVEAFFTNQFEAVRDRLDMPDMDAERAQLVGAFLSEEYAFESAALFNPSVVLHPDQSGLDTGAVRLIFSLRGIGEGHVSSVTFRIGI